LSPLCSICQFLGTFAKNGVQRVKTTFSTYLTEDNPRKPTYDMKHFLRHKMDNLQIQLYIRV
jgi:hypothetical protein